MKNKTSSAFVSKPVTLWIAIALALAVMVLVVRRAWVSDDAYITFRTVDNLLHGYRLTWNPGERVQAYTHPLWMALVSLATFFSGEVYLTSITLSLLLTGLTLAVLFYNTRPAYLRLLPGLLALGLSNAFVDYSTSGLENAFSHLLLALFCLFYFQDKNSPRHLFWLSLLASLSGLNRMDSLPVYLFPLLVKFWECPQKGQGILAGIAGQAPLMIWELFSVWYYGFLFPNTAYAKLNTGIPSFELLQQGIYYLLSALQRDPITLAAIALGVAAAFGVRRKREVALALGLLIYLAYTVKIGGDFMAGRFLTLPLVGAVFLFGRLPAFDRKPVRWPAVAGLLLLGLIAPLPAWQVQPPASYEIVDAYSIADERAWYYPGLSLWREGKLQTHPEHVWVEDGKRARRENAYGVVIQEGIGLFGYYAGPQVYIVDVHALSDPLLARLPAKRWVNWQIGHFERVFPGGYIFSLEGDRILITDEGLAEYYRLLKLVTRGSLFDPQRLQVIWNFNTGKYDDLIDRDAYCCPFMKHITLTDAGLIADDAPLSVPDQGLEVDLQTNSHAPKTILFVDGASNFRLEYWAAGRLLASDVIEANGDPVLRQVELAVPGSVAAAGYDHIRLFPQRWGKRLTFSPQRGSQNAQLGLIRLEE